MHPDAHPARALALRLARARAWCSRSCATLAPDSTVKPTDLALVKVKRATSVDLSPDVVWILAVGSDARPGEDMTRTRGDALQLIGMNTKTGAATAIGIPRDSYVSIPGVGSDRINAALYYGGPQLLGETVGDLIGIQPDYVFVTRFEKFQNDGQRHRRHRRRQPGLLQRHLPQAAGLRSRAGSTSTATSRWRSRGSARPCSRGDFDRSANQQRVLRGIQAKIRDRASGAASSRSGVLSAHGRTWTTDASPAELYRLARPSAAVKPAEDHHLRGAGRRSATSAAPASCCPYVDQARRYGRPRPARTRRSNPAIDADPSILSGCPPGTLTGCGHRGQN